jgi:N6-adenosine-specific RNA methylase IME4
MTVEEIMALDVPSIAADDCVLFLWATAPMMPQALQVMAAWGFAYKTNAVWIKSRAGTGYWLRNKHELLLIETRGAIPAPLPGRQGDSIIDAPVGGHSEKPAAFAELIERWYPVWRRSNCSGAGRPVQVGRHLAMKPAGRMAPTHP